MAALIRLATACDPHQLLGELFSLPKIDFPGKNFDNLEIVKRVFLFFKVTYPVKLLFDLKRSFFNSIDLFGDLRPPPNDLLREFLCLDYVFILSLLDRIVYVNLMIASVQETQSIFLAVPF